MISAFSAFSARGRGPARLAAVLLASGLLASGAAATAGAAAADEVPQHQGGASATLDGLKTFDRAVVTLDDTQRQIPAGLFEMRVDDGGTLQTYCIDIHNPTQKEAKYVETPWKGTSLNNNADAGRIRWILQNSYPQVNDLDGLARAAGATVLSKETAAAGTQVAIWRFSNGAHVEALDPQAEKLADHLQKKAKNLAEPKASLTLETNAVSGKAGERLGPVTVRTDAQYVTVAAATDLAHPGVRIVGRDGKPVTAATNGAQLFFDVPAGTPDGSTSLTVQATTKVPVGRAFASESRSQTQILAGSSESTVSASATATWAKKGPIPALSATKNCAKGGVDITAANEGDEAFTFELKGFKHTIAAGRSQTVTIPVLEDQAYDFTITGPDGFTKQFKGVMDCKTAGSASGAPGQPSSAPSPAGGADDSGLDLAETGSSAATPVIAGVALILVFVGAAAVFLLRKKKPTGTEE
ncbi:Cys-Gln thioester bond-forming surface protein [Streptomyces sp. NPDC051219]|uniref:Cys-Gln thioester bond-forming surface protein n=1 Tax=Streptomyces sp. NPDC051219 TaxID=3155283 RepID=UPI003414DD18